ncbi:phosphatase PAP2 family protein [Streptomyces polygonati]|uniref:Phosphatase PAP2 family protein n=1 Tax=Streptomyces polygonati TaxID=1617087 RepID=A0ABV8HLN3_9ACTN
MTPIARRPTRRAVALAACPAALFLLLLAAVSARGGAPLGPDLALHHWAVDHRPGDLRQLALLVSSTGTGPLPYVAAMLAGWTACARSAEPRQEVAAALAAVAVLLTGQGLRLAAMAAVARPRPPMADWATVAGGSSFPSGHTTSTALAAGLLVFSAARSGAPRPVVRAWLAACVCWAVGVGATRVYLGVHWPTDVLGGWLLAAAWLALTLPLLTRVAGPRGRALASTGDTAPAR